MRKGYITSNSGAVVIQSFLSKTSFVFSRISCDILWQPEKLRTFHVLHQCLYVTMDLFTYGQYQDYELWNCFDMWPTMDHWSFSEASVIFDIAEKNHTIMSISLSMWCNKLYLMLVTKFTIEMYKLKQDYTLPKITCKFPKR